MQKLFNSLFLFLLLLTGPTWAGDASYISLNQVNLAKLLAPPPATQSDQQKLDLMAVIQAQKGRTASQSERAVADNDYSIFRMAGEVLGPNFTAERVPKTAAFFARVIQDARVLF